MIKPAIQVSSKPLLRPIYLSDTAIRQLISNNGKHIRTAITNKDLDGSRFEYDENHDPVMGVVNNKTGVMTKPTDPITPSNNIIYSPFGNVGAKVVVKEVWRIGSYDKIRGLFAIDYQSTPEIKKTAWVRIPSDPDASKFRAHLATVKAELKAKGIKPNEDGTWSWEAGQAPLRWQSASSMPEWASRFKLVVSKVGVQPSLDNVFNYDFLTDFEPLKE